MPNSELPPLILGAASLQERSDAFLDAWYASGGRAIDTARSYGDSEKFIGEWLASREYPDVMVITKGCHPDRDGSRMTEPKLKEDLERSMSALRGYPIHSYLYHRDELSLEPEAMLEWLQPHVKCGQMKEIGVSNWHHRRIEQANAWARARGLHEFKVNSPQFSAVKAEALAWPGCVSVSGDDEALAWHAKESSPDLVAWQPLAAGFLTHKSEPTPYLAEAYGAFDTPANRVIKQSLVERAQADKLDLSQLALRTLLEHPKAHVIVGTRSVNRWEQAMAALDSIEQPS